MKKKEFLNHAENCGSVWAKVKIGKVQGCIEVSPDSVKSLLVTWTKKEIGEIKAIVEERPGERRLVIL